MLKPFYQGKVDTFCAIYAVLNTLRLTHGIRTLKARAIFNETLLELAARPGALEAVLEQETDYIDLVDAMLEQQRQRLPLEILRPFDAASRPGADELWAVCQKWLAPGANRSVLIRFTHNAFPEGGPSNRHWSNIREMDERALHLFDCSHEAEAVQHIHRDAFVTDPKDIRQGKLIFIQPKSLRLVRLPF